MFAAMPQTKVKYEGKLREDRSSNQKPNNITANYVVHDRLTMGEKQQDLQGGRHLLEVLAVRQSAAQLLCAPRLVRRA